MKVACENLGSNLQTFRKINRPLLLRNISIMHPVMLFDNNHVLVESSGHVLVGDYVRISGTLGAFLLTSMEFLLLSNFTLFFKFFFISIFIGK